MDPDATLRRMVRAMAEGDRDEALDAMDDLRGWLMAGGFLPERAAEEMIARDREDA